MKKINILCATDDNYVSYCGIMLTSLFENNKDVNIDVYLMTAGLNDKNRLDFISLSEKYGVNIHIVKVDDDALKNCPIRLGDHVSLVTYYRLLAPILLPNTVDRILYLDCDMIVNSSIKVLYNENIDDCAYGAVLDEAFQDIEKYERLEYQREKLYCNAGMMLINLEYWRKNQVMERCLDYIEKNPSKVLFHDQDTINVVLQDEKKLLPLKYNFQTGFILSHYKFDDIIMHEILETVYSPVIIHYTGGISKPWFAKSKHPYTNIFLYYKNISLWRKFPLLDRRTFYNKFVDFLLELIWTLGIKKRPKSYIIEMQNK